jgi:hypothetical protein
MAPRHRPLSAWHEDAHGHRIEHEIAWLREGTPRALVTRWKEKGAWSLDVTEREPGSFTGALERPGSAKPIFASCNVTEIDGHLHIHVNARYDGNQLVWTIEAHV